MHPHHVSHTQMTERLESFPTIPLASSGHRAKRGEKALHETPRARPPSAGSAGSRSSPTTCLDDVQLATGAIQALRGGPDSALFYKT